MPSIELAWHRSARSQARSRRPRSAPILADFGGSSCPVVAAERSDMDGGPFARGVYAFIADACGIARMANSSSPLLKQPGVVGLRGNDKRHVRRSKEQHVGTAGHSAGRIGDIRQEVRARPMTGEVLVHHKRVTAGVRRCDLVQ